MAWPFGRVQEGVGCVLEWRLRWHGRSVGGGTDCRPEWPTGGRLVVFDDNKVWATCWNGGWGGMANLVGDATDCRPGWPTGNAWVVFGDNKWATCWNGGWGGMAVQSVM